jgi:phosphopentomutase
MITRVFLLVLDGVGVGEAPDAAEYGDAGCNTLAHVAQAAGGLRLPHLESLGLGHVGDFAGVRRVGDPDGCFGRMAERSKGKDTTTGHWELAGQVVEKPFPTYPQGFPDEIIRPFEEAIGRRVLGNRPASGTAIIAALGEEHLRTGRPIVYTSADSVFQVAAHERIVPPAELYRWCRAARRLLAPPHQVARVIARPFTGEPGAFVRTEGRKDFSLDPPGRTLLDLLQASGQPVVAIGKIHDLFNGRGVSRALHAGNNGTVMDEVLRALATVPRGLIFANLVDFDMLYGHRNDALGYARALEAFDERLGALLKGLRPGDLLLLTADHGNDPTTPGTDHTREYVPLLAWGPRLTRGVNLGTRPTFADLGRTVSDALGGGRLAWGESFLDAFVSG